MDLAAQNQVMLKKLLAIVVLMGAFGLALVPFYKKICEVTGISQTRVVTRAEAKNTQVDLSRTITVQFDATINQQMPWRFAPEQRTIQIHPGEVAQMVYTVTNTTGKAMVGQARPSYGPEIAGKYFNKLECFCFNQQTLAANETRQMPVVFYIGRDLPKNVTTLTLSYTFFDMTAELGDKS
jgi:cytochrome c oxidase assembly protein subunit 11